MTAIDLAYVHVVLNHVPIIGFAGGILLLASALVARSRDLAVAGLVALVLVALVSLPVYFTGEHAEERVEHLAGVSHDDIEEHEDAAWFAIVFIEIVGAAALVALIITRRRVELSRGILTAILLLSLFTSTVIARTAYLGGKIRHTEFSSGAAAADEEAEDSGQGRGRGRGGQ